MTPSRPRELLSLPCDWATAPGTLPADRGAGGGRCRKHPRAGPPDAGLPAEVIHQAGGHAEHRVDESGTDQERNWQYIHFAFRLNTLT